MSPTATAPHPGLLQRAAAVNPSPIILLSPVLFWIHILEEGTGFIRWLNSIASPPLPEAGFVPGNVPFLLITALLAGAAVFIRRKASALALLFWLSYVMFANTLFHVTATLFLHRYCPGLITALALYLPFYFWFIWYLRAKLQIGTLVVALAALLGTLVVYQQWHAIIWQAARQTN